MPAGAVARSNGPVVEGVDEPEQGTPAAGFQLEAQNLVFPREFQQSRRVEHADGAAALEVHMRIEDEVQRGALATLSLDRRGKPMRQVFRFHQGAPYPLRGVAQLP